MGPAWCRSRYLSAGGAEWRGRPWEETVLYELHAGLLGRASGRCRGAAGLVELGVTAIELMPIAEFTGDAQLGL